MVDTLKNKAYELNFFNTCIIIDMESPKDKGHSFAMMFQNTQRLFAQTTSHISLPDLNPASSQGRLHAPKKQSFSQYIYATNILLEHIGIEVLTFSPAAGVRTKPTVVNKDTTMISQVQFAAYIHRVLEINVTQIAYMHLQTANWLRWIEMGATAGSTLRSPRKQPAIT